MCKSVRNQLVKNVEQQLYNAIVHMPSHIVEQQEMEKYYEATAVFTISNGSAPFSLIIEQDGKVFPADGVTKIYIQGDLRIMSVIAELYDMDTDKFYLASGFSLRKTGDTWSPWQGYKVCCTRVARDFANKYFQPEYTKIQQHREEIKRIEQSIANIEKEFLTGGNNE